MAKKQYKIDIRKLIYVFLFIAVLGFSGSTCYKNWQSKFEAPRKDSKPIEFTISKDMTLAAVIGDLHYYDFIKDETTFEYALSHTKDIKVGGGNSLKVGNNTIDREARYTISQSMTAWEIANILVNNGEYSPCNNGCPDSAFNPELLPGGDIAPTLKEKYSWIKTYEECTKAIGHDGGQLSSEQYYQKTGIRRCVAPDGREFTEGKEGWSDTPSP